MILPVTVIGDDNHPVQRNQKEVFKHGGRQPATF